MVYSHLANKIVPVLYSEAPPTVGVYDYRHLFHERMYDFVVLGHIFKGISQNESNFDK